MEPQPITVQFQGSQLIAVPSIHFSHVLACEVNRICRDPRLRPEAVAVELSPWTAVAAATWLKELNETDEASKALPVMLGLMKPNRMLRPSLKQKCLDLQRKTRKDLSELPPEILHKELGYSGHGLLCLTPTDSIIEAIRCAIELNVPIYGVDLEEMAEGDYAFLNPIEDPIGAGADVAAYVDQNAGYAGEQHDEEIDIKREIAMAARLKRLLSMYRKVLFICGMGHWIHIQNHIRNPSIRPAILPKTTEIPDGEFKRVVVHPQIAIDYMDLFPALVIEYQKMRKPCNWDGCLDKPIQLNARMIFENLMKAVYKEHFFPELSGERFRQPSDDLACLQAFQSYLAKTTFLNLRWVPDIFTTARCAREMMSRDFQKTLIEKFLDFPWTSPLEHPDYNFLFPSPSRGTHSTSACRLRDQGGTGHRGDFYIRSIPENKASRHTEIRFKWRHEPKTEKTPIHAGMVYTWTPWSYLLSAICLRGISTSKKWEREKCVEPFCGSFLSGLAVKEMIRGYARGEDRLYVYDTIKTRRPDHASFADGFPVVLILDPDVNKGHYWAPLFIDFSWVSEFIRDRASLEDVEKRRGSKMIAMIGYGDHGVKTGLSTKSRLVHTDRYYGMTIYQPDCWTMDQYARWMELTSYNRNPYCKENILNKDYPSDLKASLEEEHGIRMGQYDWPTTLILLAIPYAKERVTVIVPNDYQFNPMLFKKATKYGVELSRVSLNCLSPKEKKRVMLNHMAPASNPDLQPRVLFDSSVEETIGELQTDNSHLVPKACMDFGKE